MTHCKIGLLLVGGCLLGLPGSSPADSVNSGTRDSHAVSGTLLAAQQPTPPLPPTANPPNPTPPAIPSNPPPPPTAPSPPTPRPPINPPPSPPPANPPASPPNPPPANPNPRPPALG